MLVNDLVTVKFNGIGSRIAKNENPGVTPQIMLLTVSRDEVMSVQGGTNLYNLNLFSFPVT